MTRHRPRVASTTVIVVIALTILGLLASCGSAEPTTETAASSSTSSARSAGSTGTRPPGTSTPSTTVETTTTAPATTSSVLTTTAPPPPTAPPTTPAPLPPEPAPTMAPTPDPPPLPAGPNSVFVLGDSVLLGTTYGSPPAMVAALPGWAVTLDCGGSRRLTQGLGALQARRGEIGRAAVIQLGNNYIPGEGGSFGGQIDQAMAILEGTDRVVWLTVGEAIPGRADLNAEIRAAAARHPTMVVADWASMVAADPSLAPGDGLHLSNVGRVAISELVAGALGPAPG